VTGGVGTPAVAIGNGGVEVAAAVGRWAALQPPAGVVEEVAG
jgi:hypothetical protein